MTTKKKKETEKTDLPKKAMPSEVPIEELDKKITATEKKLQELGIERDVWVKKPIDVDPSFHFFFTKLKDPKGTLMLRQHAGIALRLLEAPPYLKRAAIKYLNDLVAFVSAEQEPSVPEKKPKRTPKKKKKTT